MKAADIAFGFANTVDYELVWNPARLELAITAYGIHAAELREMSAIADTRDLVISILYHMTTGTGCGIFVENEALLDEYLVGTEYTVTLGGTNIRAAETVSRMGETSGIHLVSINDITLARLPHGAQWVCANPPGPSLPHVVIQYPKGARIHANDIEIVAPSANRVIYTHDVYCSNLAIDSSFFERMRNCRIMVLSSFDVVLDEHLLRKRLAQTLRGIERLNSQALIFYEDACFANPRLRRLVLEQITPVTDVHSMNEDEFCQLCGKAVGRYDAPEILRQLKAVQSITRARTLIVHTRDWTLCFGGNAERYRKTVRMGMDTATTRFRLGDAWTKTDYLETTSYPFCEEAEEFSHLIETLSGGEAICLATRRQQHGKATTIGLGDCFVGGFAIGYVCSI